MKTILNTILKPILAFLAFQFILPLSVFANNDASSMNLVQSGERITVKFGTRSHPTENGCGGDKGICIIITTSIIGGRMPELQENEGVAEVLLLKGNKMLFNIIADNGSKEEANSSIFHVYKDYYLSPEVCQALGKKKVVILKGDYLVDYSKATYGGVVLNVSVQ